ncbi:hypothetical protein D1007_40196 [Hordeum vulgare]|nr:hypothetical protein D1007_40196 [Hordeum vulgare]
MVRQRITTYAQLTPECWMQIEAEIQARRAAHIVAGFPAKSPKTEEKEEEEELKEEEPKDDDDPPSFNMAEAEEEFAVAQADEMAEHQAILDSIRDDTEVEANRRLIRQRQAEAGALFDEVKAEIAVEEAASEQPKGSEGAATPASEGVELHLPHIYLLEGMKIVDISDEE